MLIHPRVPPIVRLMPHVEALSLFKAEESQEEAETLSSLGMADLHLHTHQTDDLCNDVIMKDSNIAETFILEVPKQGAQGISHTSIDHNDSPHPYREAKDRQINVPTQDLVDMERTDEKMPIPTVKFSTFVDVAKADTAPTPQAIVFLVDQEEDQEEDDEEMPAIDMGSDSEDEED